MAAIVPVFHPLEIWEHVRVAPALSAAIAPIVVVVGMASRAVMLKIARSPTLVGITAILRSRHDPAVG